MAKPETTPEQARQNLSTLAEHRGQSLAALSTMLGHNRGYLQRFVTKGTPQRLADRDQRLLADFFGADEVDLGATRSAISFK